MPLAISAVSVSTTNVAVDILVSTSGQRAEDILEYIVLHFRSFAICRRSIFFELHASKSAASACAASDAPVTRGGELFGRSDRTDMFKMQIVASLLIGQCCLI